MFESMSFTYDGVNSEDFGVMMVNSNTGLFKEPFLAARSITEKSIAGRDVPLFGGVSEKPLSFPLTIFIEEWEKRDNLRAIARWLNQKEYKPLWFETDPDRRFYALIDGTPVLNHNGIKEGFITLNVRCMTHYMSSAERVYKKIVNGTADDWINNDGDEPFAPRLTIKKIGNGDVKIETFLEGKRTHSLQIVEMLDGEIAYLDCAMETIRSSHQEYERYLFDLCNHDYLTFGIGNPYNTESSTKIVFTGNFEFIMDYSTAYRAA